jgi:hypothetical protein
VSELWEDSVPSAGCALHTAQMSELRGNNDAGAVENGVLIIDHGPAVERPSAKRGDA